MTLEEALRVQVRGRALGTLRLPALRIIALWVRNQLDAHPNDRRWHDLEHAVRLVMTYRRTHPLPLPSRDPFAPAVPAAPVPVTESHGTHD